MAGTRFDCAATEHKGLTETGTNRVFGDWSLFWLTGESWVPERGLTSLLNHGDRLATVLILKITTYIISVNGNRK